MNLAVVNEAVTERNGVEHQFTEEEKNFVVQFAFRSGSKEDTISLIEALAHSADKAESDEIMVTYRSKYDMKPAWVEQVENLLVALEMYRIEEEKAINHLADILNASGAGKTFCDITQLGYKCEIEKEKNIIYTTDEIRFRADFVIKTELLKEYGIREWAFDVYVGPHRPVMQKLSWFFGCCYVNSLRDNGTKLSLVLSNKDEFDAAKRRLGTIKIHDIISIILINEENWELEEEFVIPTYDKVDMPTLGGATYGR